MISINNNIDAEINAKIYFGSQYIGTCKNELAFLDVRRQIRKGNLEGYFVEFTKTENYSTEYSGKIEINKFGGLELSKTEIYWYSWDEIINDLIL